MDLNEISESTNCHSNFDDEIEDNVKLTWKLNHCKHLISETDDILNDDEAIGAQVLLQDTIGALMLTNLEYCVENNLEKDLWIYCFKKFIDAAKHESNNYDKDVLDFKLSSFVSFYWTLLRRLCSVYKNIAYLPPFPKNFVEKLNQMSFECKPTLAVEPSVECVRYVCHYCLLRLADLQRYSGDMRLATILYKNASVIRPEDGEAYNKLALCAHKGDRIAIAYYCMRALACSNPFTTAEKNFTIALTPFATTSCSIMDASTASGFEACFLALIGKLNKDNRRFETVAFNLLKEIKKTIHYHLHSRTFSTLSLIQMTMLSMYAYSLRKSVVALQLIFTFFDAFTHLSEVIQLTPRYYALPPMKLICDWMGRNAEVLTEEIVVEWPGADMWHNFVSLLNMLLRSDPFIRIVDERDQKKLLPEDQECQGFLPLHWKSPDCTWEDVKMESYDNENLIRASRLVAFARWLPTTISYRPILLIQTKADNQIELVGLLPPNSSTICSQLRGRKLEPAVLENDNQQSATSSQYYPLPAPSPAIGSLAHLESDKESENDANDSSASADLSESNDEDEDIKILLEEAATISTKGFSSDHRS